MNFGAEGKQVLAVCFKMLNLDNLIQKVSTVYVIQCTGMLTEANAVFAVTRGMRPNLALTKLEDTMQMVCLDDVTLRDKSSMLKLS